MANYAAVVNSHVSVFCGGVVDSFSFHRAAKFVVNSASVRQEIGMTVKMYTKFCAFFVLIHAAYVLMQLMANGCLLLGSVFLYTYFIEPVSHLMRGAEATYVASMSVWSFYHLLWVLPIWGLCYGVSLGCYQTIADDVHRLQQSESRSKRTSAGQSLDVKRSISGSVYAALVWALMFLQIRVFDLLLPSLLRHAARVVLAALQALHPPPPVLQVATLVLVQPLLLTGQGLQLFGLIIGAIVYGWYGFDMEWIAAGQEPEQRFRAVEQHWVYFCGFGLPYLLLLKCTSFFLGYGVYLMLFPFTIMLGSVCDWQQRPQGQGGHSAFRVFAPSQRLALLAIKAADKHLRPSRAKKSHSR